NDAVKNLAWYTSPLRHPTPAGSGFDMTVQIEAGRGAKVPVVWAELREELISGAADEAGAPSATAAGSATVPAEAARCAENHRSKDNALRCREEWWRPRAASGRALRRAD